ncbi:NAD(P)H-hydrate dehydratase [uncultured Rhodoblastus sp.]|uniref:NAD(P)H-hydrate dehydratase n=1 Tax=uncultured Rhodoblastus sp. TaxID=543037 RepID=UPI0025DCB2FD|nr:NAD(P)H-hydrate dehydratase [uncultured Rhodoblastus sp.]
MQMNLSHDDPIELLTPAEMARADALTMASGAPGYALMLQAGRNIAEAAAGMLRAGEGQTVRVYCGPGKNGGDGYVAARLLREKGFDVEVGALGDPRLLRGDAAAARAEWGNDIVPAEQLDPRGANLAIDALFGAGLARPLDGAALAVVQKINASGAPTLAVDVPSGMDGANGAIGSECVVAAETVTFFRLKPGHLLAPGRFACGRIRLTQIGMVEETLAAIKPQTYLNAPDLWRDALPRPRPDGHKYQRGHLLVGSGPMTQTGAARLAARAGLRVGAGLVTVVSPAEALAVHAATLTAIMLRQADNPLQWRELLADPRFCAAAIGPGFGIGPATRRIVETLLAASPKSGLRPLGLVLDADALTSYAADWDVLARLVQLSGAEVVLTPHEGEFNRLFNKQATIPQMRADRGGAGGGLAPLAIRPFDLPYKIDRARAAAKAVGACIVYKGPDTVVAAPDGRACIARNAPPTLATAGSGDVLAGLIGGLLAQGMPMFEASACAVWLHGEAAALFGPGLVAEDLPEILPRVLTTLFSREG